MSFPWSLVLILLAAYLVLVVWVFLFQSRLIYFPYKKLVATPEDIGLIYESVEFTTPDGTQLHGWFIPHPDPRATVLFCHGNAGNISHRLDTARILQQLRLNTLLFDYRGYGHSRGLPSEQGTYQDVQAAWDFLTRQQGITPGRIVLFGRSLGGAIASWLATQVPAGGLIVESVFTSIPDLGTELYPFLPVRILSRFQYPTREHLRQTRLPVLIVHSQEDEIVPYRHAQALYEVAHSPKALLQIRGGHNEGFVLSGASYLQGLDQFLQTYLEG
jgi:pimeloyl-ACP methyl ester carboxylesterase